MEKQTLLDLNINELKKEFINKFNPKNCNYRCLNCTYCFLCKNINSKKYMILNVQLTKEEYFEKLKELA